MTTIEVNYPTSRKTLAAEYGIGKDLLRKWLRDIGIMHGRNLTPAEVRQIYREYGKPSDLLEASER